MSKLTFQIQNEASLVGVERFTLARLRRKLFGTGKDKPAVSFQTIPSSRKYGQSRPAPVAVARPSYFDPAPNETPFVATPEKSGRAKPAFVPISPVAVASVQTIYKGHMIHAVRLEDGSWASFHNRLDADPATMRNHPSPTAQRFMARVLAVASAEIEIDDLEKA